MINQITTNPAGENLSLLPALSPTQENTKEYKAIIDGAVDSTSSVKSFKWLATPKVSSTTSTDGSETQTASPIQQSAQQAVQKAKTNVQNAINKVINIPISTQTTPTTNTNQNNSNGVADFINKLPDLNN